MHTLRFLFYLVFVFVFCGCVAIKAEHSKGVRGVSPNINSAACGECRESQGSPSKAQASRWRKRNENREEIFPARERSEQGLKFPRFVAGVAFHTCAALSKANWRFAVEGNLLPTACKCPLWWGAGKPTAGDNRTPLRSLPLASQGRTRPILLRKIPFHRYANQLAFFASQKPFRRCASRAFGYFRHESNVIHDTVNKLFIEGVGKAVILYNYAFVLMRFFTCKQVQNDNPSVLLRKPPPLTQGGYFLPPGR